MTDSEWELYVEENALVADFPADMTLTDEVFAAVNERFDELADDPAVDTHVSLLRMESSLDGDVFDRAMEAAAAGTEYGIDSWIVVSDGIKKMALRSRVSEVAGVDVVLADTKTEALELARA